ncbi:MAG: 23S rRNA (guanosine(2251)-2'-O)-methyltransferase RlmB, partial [Acidimicrobiales bacterium]
VVLDGVTDPANLGAIMRSALCAGVAGLVVGQHRAVQLTPTAVKSAAGATEHLPLSVVPGVPSALSRLSALGRWTVGLDSAGPTSLWELPVADQPLALVVGAEGSGLGRLVRDRCEVLARIPISGPIGSLNVSAATAVAVFELARRRGAPS